MVRSAVTALVRAARKALPGLPAPVTNERVWRPAPHLSWQLQFAARLATALGVDRALDGTDACAAGETPLRMLTGTPTPPDQVRSGPRTGVAGEGGNGDVHPWRFWVADDPTVSPYRAHVPRRRRS